MASAESPGSPDRVDAASASATGVSSGPVTAPRRRPGVRLAVPPLAAAMLCAVVFGLLSWQVLAGGPLTVLDRLVRDAVLRGRAAPADTVVTPLAQLAADAANWPVAGCLLLATAVATGALSRGRGLSRRVRPLVLAAVVATLALGSTVGLKDALGRPGPVPRPGMPAVGYFPSGHMVTAAVCFGLGAMLLGPRLRCGWSRLLTVVAWVGCLAVATGLVWCEYHWMSDVLAGAALSGMLLCGLRATALRRCDPGNMER